MDLYINSSKIAEIIGVEEDIITRTLERRDVDIESYIRVVSAPPDIPGNSPKPQVQLRVDGLAMLIRKLAFNIPTDDIIENLSCQVFHITHLQEMCDKLEAENQALVAENAQLREAIESIRNERGDLSAQINELTNQLREEQSITWVGRLLKRGN